MKKIFCAVIIAALMCSSCFAAAKNKDFVEGGVLTYLGTTESEFQEALDDLRKALSPLLPADDGDIEDWENFDNFSGFMSELVKTRRLVHFYDSLLSMQMAMQSGKIQEMILPEPVGMYLISVNPKYDILFSLNMMPSTISFGFKSGNTTLQKEFNAAISAMRKDGTLDRLAQTYIEQLEGEPARVEFESFKNAATIKVAVTGDLPPIDYMAADGTPTGYNTAILSEIGRRLKKNIQLLSIDAGGRSAALASGRADVVFWYRNTEGLKTPAKLKGKNLKGVMKDSLEGVILSAPYYEWDVDLVLGKAN